MITWNRAFRLVDAKRFKVRLLIGNRATAPHPIRANFVANQQQLHRAPQSFISESTTKSSPIMLKFSVIGGTMVASFRESGKPFFHMEIDNDATVIVETPTYDEMVEMFQTKYQTAYDTFEDFKKNHNFDTPQRDNQDSGNRIQIDRDANVAVIPGDGDSWEDTLMQHFDKIYQMVVNFFDDDSYESEVEKMFNK